MSAEAPEPVDVRNNPESRAGASDASSTVARASDGGAPPRDAPAAGELPKSEKGGTADGNPVSGVTISAEDEADAVSGDTGALELGQNGSTPNQ